MFTDGSQLLAECNKAAYSKACLSGLLTFRCASYTSDFYKTGQCLDAARAAADILDIQAPAIDGSIAFVAYTGDLYRLLQEPFTQRYLKALEEQLDQGRFGDNFDLWDFTRRACRGDSSCALRMIGVVLQDTSTDKIHLNYMGDKYADKLPSEVLPSLAHVLDLLEPSQLAKNNGSKWLTLYPELPNKADTHFRTNLYHFYTISYLALRLNWQLHNQRLAAFLPLLLEASYKFRKIAPGRWPLQDPATIDPNVNGDELKDLFTAYVGSRWAVGATAKDTLSYDDFTRRMAANPYALLKDLYLNQ